MLGLPKATELSKPLSKKAIFDKFKPSLTDRKLFDDQISRLSIVAEISPQTVAIKASADVSAVYVVLVTLKTAECDQKNITLLSKLIDQRMLFVLQFGDTTRLAVYRAEKVLVSESKPLGGWKLSLIGLDLEAIWENVIAQIGGIDLTGGADLDATIAENNRQEKLHKQIAALEKKAMTERQPRRKWELAEKIRRLKIELGGTSNE
ncbi:Protein of unknown function DUF4391 [Acididesulfobacillus acetoxydans]|uniref:DUF4391 domain-containing protein n=1 Tax=Acididesulfobacillus acetoxydans TaxID=1561005 RepID=A0A8S0XB74_9FIRM|nr:DUF4391 domain-containing protein [Acididesulfobacillus acetoxydans]CAA7600856.1 Protein of unknown function DUF4391 [Acididesulfobacillus acetoxydans]CEJ07205.1 Domain of unknown function (DUF4391) [Acididesulfobacillus acetoxydans]